MKIKSRGNEEDNKTENQQVERAHYCAHGDVRRNLKSRHTIESISISPCQDQKIRPRVRGPGGNAQLALLRKASHKLTDHTRKSLL